MGEELLLVSWVFMQDLGTAVFLQRQRRSGYLVSEAVIP